MRTIEAIPQETGTCRGPADAPMRRHDKKRASSWRVLGATVSGFPAFLWQLSRNHNS